MGVHVFLRHFQTLFEVFRGVVLHDGADQGGIPGVIVPADGHMGEIGHIVFCIDSFPFLLYVGQNVGKAAVTVHEMHELVVGHTVDAQRGNDVSGRAGFGSIHAADVDSIFAPDGQLQMQIRETGGLYLIPEFFQRRTGIVHAAKTPDQVADIVDHEHGTAVYFIIIGLAEILGDDSVADLVKFFLGHGAFPDLGMVEGIALVPQIHGVMVCPHEVEGHIGIVFRPQEAVVQALFQEGAAVIPVPVVDKHVDAVFGGLFDLELHDFGIGFVLVAPQGNSGQLLTGHTGFSGLHGLPFADALFPEDAGTGFVTGIGGPDVCGNIVFFHGWILLTDS